MDPNKKRESCSTCGKKLKISEINMCSCGVPVCSKHRYYTDHKCLRKIGYIPCKGIEKPKVIKI